MTALLVVQFVVGMYLNFFVKLPDSHPGTTGSYAPSIPWALGGHAGVALTIHIALWILLTLLGVGLLVSGIMIHRRAYIVGSSLGFVFILLAGSGGLNFLNHGGSDTESMIMAIGFILALAAYGMTLYKTKEP